MAEFIGNNTESETIKVTFIFVNKGFYPYMSFEPLNPKARLANANKVNANTFINWMQELQEILWNQMLMAQANHKCHANHHQSTAPQYKIGNMVWLDTWNLMTKKLCEKLKNYHASSYPVRQIVSTHVIKLELSKDIHIYLMFHVNLLEPAAIDSPYAEHIQSPSPPVKVNGKIK